MGLTPGTWISLVLTALLTACGPSRRDAAVLELLAEGDTLLAPYGEVSEGAWLERNRWAVLAQADELVALLDFGRHSAKPVADRSSRELRNPANLFVAEDTLYIGDWGLRRLTLWHPSGRLVRSIPAPDAVRGTLPRARDTVGNFYFDVYPPPGPDGSGNRDSVALVRTDAQFRQVDTVARLAPFEVAEVVGQAGRRFERRVFSGMDRWGALPDGSLWVARVYDNRVDWRTPDGKWSRGQPLPDRVLEVTRYDRELFLRRFPPELRRSAQELPFAAIKPPFEAGLTAPSGEVWLEKSRAPGDSSRRYHVVDAGGKLFREIRVRGPGRILALAPTIALVAEPTPDGTRLIAMRLPTELSDRE